MININKPHMLEQQHIFWTCPEIHTFWRNIWKIMQHILRTQIPLTCLWLFLGEIQRNDKYLLKRYLLLQQKSFYWIMAQIWFAHSKSDLEIIRQTEEMKRLTLISEHIGVLCVYLQSQSILKTPPNILAFMPAGRTQWIGDPPWWDSDAKRAKPEHNKWDKPIWKCVNDQQRNLNI